MAKNAAGQAGQESKNFMNQQIDQRSTQAGEQVRADCRDRTRAARGLASSTKERAPDVSAN